MRAVNIDYIVFFFTIHLDYSTLYQAILGVKLMILIKLALLTYAQYCSVYLSL